MSLLDIIKEDLHDFYMPHDECMKQISIESVLTVEQCVELTNKLNGNEKLFQDNFTNIRDWANKNICITGIANRILVAEDRKTGSHCKSCRIYNYKGRLDL